MTCKPRMVVPGPKPLLTECHVEPSNFIKNAEPLFDAPLTHNCEASVLAADMAVTGPGITLEPGTASQVWALASYMAIDMLVLFAVRSPPTMSLFVPDQTIALTVPESSLPG